MYLIDYSSNFVQPIYASNLTINSSKFSASCIQPYYYYEAIQINVIEDSGYTFGTYSKIDTYGYLYEDQFNPFDPSTNHLKETSMYGICEGQFKITHHLIKQKTYILVVTTVHPNVTGAFAIVVLSPHNITLRHIGNSSCQ